MHEDSTREQFMAKVARSADTDCWLWTGEITPKGYGRLKVKGVRIYAHRLAYELFVGPFPPGLVTDHLCRVRHCVNPAHLEAVTNAENVRRGEAGRGTTSFNRAKTHCPYGHPYAGDNLYLGPVLSSGGRRRSCRECALRRAREQHRRRKVGES